ncbi:recombination regulator RecX [Corynebacterium xerosis]|uniref:Regulatory protein RecX n=1 Tax=Corynebacterium xerosis TaxID=1725 RepID=A0A6B8TVG3_9CORY|nr:regulatory protein RecX [Corynebacterium xerosis]QGS35430.1 recombination regulator RecX [Corynebacterium xerosis]
MTGTGEARDAKLEKLRAAMEKVAAEGGEPIIDADAEAVKAPIRSRALRLLDSRARSRTELRERLAENEDWPAVAIDEVLDDLTASKLLDDAHFAREWVRQRHVGRGKSRMVLDRELVEKGIPAHLREEALEQVSDADESAIARSLAEKKARTIKAVPADRAARDKDLRRVVGVLARRGFNQGLSMAIALDAIDARYDELSS